MIYVYFKINMYSYPTPSYPTGEYDPPGNNIYLKYFLWSLVVFFCPEEILDTLS